MNEMVFSTQGLSKWFGQVIAVNDLSFSSSARIVGLLGPNGAGKSTLIKLLTGQIRPSQGKVQVFGQDPWNNLKFFSQLGYCPEHDRFYEDLGAQQFVELLTRLQGFDAAQATKLAAAALGKVELSAKAEAPIRTLSHGMRQRLKVAQAMAHGPQCLVLDEPLSGLDPLNRARMIALIKQEADRGVAVLISSHVLHELESMTQDVIMLNKGRLVAQGQVASIRELIDAHPHRIALTAESVRELGRELLRFDDVVRVEVGEERVVVETHSPDTCYQRIGQLAAAGDFKIGSMVSLDDNLEAVFEYLVK